MELLDERSKQYSVAGDDSISETITDLVRGTLCPAIKQVLEHGMKRPSFLGKLYKWYLHMQIFPVASNNQYEGIKYYYRQNLSK